jgi:diguanylate cyclase (GGDEF)-like protein
MQASYSRASFYPGTCMLHLHRNLILASIVALIALSGLYAYVGVLKPFYKWHWMDIVGEGGTAIMAGVWLLMTLSSRPKGRVTLLLALGLASIMSGSWADCMDEFFAIPKEDVWDNWLEDTLTLGGMLILTAGMYYWRIEQFSLNEHLQKRERLFREHKPYDRVTQLSDADYLRLQIRLEKENRPAAVCSVVLLDINSFHQINRHFGQHEGDRVLQAVSHMLLLNLRNEDVLCRYAGDRFAIVMPETTVADADELAKHLCQMVQGMRHFAKRELVRLGLRYTCAVSDGDADSLLQELSRGIDCPGTTPSELATASHACAA